MGRKTKYCTQSFVLSLCMALCFITPTAAAQDLNKEFSEDRFYSVVEQGDEEQLKIYLLHHKADIPPHHYIMALYRVLHDASRQDQVVRIRLLLKAGAPPDLHAPLSVATSPEILKLFLGAGANVRPENEPSPLYSIDPLKPAAVELTALLLEAGADPNAAPWNSGRGWQTPLTHGMTLNAPAMLSGMLLKAGADPDRAAPGERTPLETAINADRPDICTLLLEAGADPNLGNPMAQAISGNHKDIIELLFRHGASMKGEAGGESLRLAAFKGDTALARRLLDAGADPRSRDKSGYTALDAAENNKDLLGRQTKEGKQISAMLREAGALSGLESQRKIYAAAGQSSPDELAALLRTEAASLNPEVLNHALLQALRASRLRDRHEVVALLLAQGAATSLELPLREGVPPRVLQVFVDAGTNVRPERGIPPLLLISWDKSDAVELARVLLNAGADPNAAEPEKGLPLPLALVKGTPLAALALPVVLASGQDVSRWPLMFAASAGKPDALALLLDYGAEIAAVDNLGVDALFYAVRAGRGDNAALLLRRGASPNGHRALEAAALSGVDIVRLLLESGADAGSDEGFRALRQAVAEGTPETVEMLIKAGADVRRKDDGGKSLLELARGRKSYMFLASPEGQAIEAVLRGAGL